MTDKRLLFSVDGDDISCQVKVKQSKKELISQVVNAIHHLASADFCPVCNSNLVERKASEFQTNPKRNRFEINNGQK